MSSRQSFHCRHRAVNIAEFVRQDSIEYWQSKFEIRVRICLVNKTRDLPICFSDSMAINFFFSKILFLQLRLFFQDTIGFIS